MCFSLNGARIYDTFSNQLEFQFILLVVSTTIRFIALTYMEKFGYGQKSDFRAEFGKNNASIQPEALYKNSMAFQWAYTPPAPKFLFSRMPKTHAISFTLTCNFYAYYFQMCYEQQIEIHLATLDYIHLWINIVNSFITICKSTLPKHAYSCLCLLRTIFSTATKRLSCL